MHTLNRVSIIAALGLALLDSSVSAKNGWGACKVGMEPVTEFLPASYVGGWYEQMREDSIPF